MPRSAKQISTQFTTELNAYLYDKVADSWSESVPLTALNSEIGGFSGFMTSSGQMTFAFGKTQILGAAAEGDPLGQTDLCTLQASPGYNLAIVGDATYDQNQLVSGNQLGIYVDYINNGEYTADQTLIQLFDDQNQEISSSVSIESVRPGESATVAVSYKVPENLSLTNLRVAVTPLGYEDYDLRDNSANVSLNYIDVSVEGVGGGIDQDGKQKIIAQIVNRGISDSVGIVANLVEDTPEGAVLQSKTITNIGVLETLTISFEQELPEGISDKTYYIQVEPLFNESNLGNNNDYITIQRIAADKTCTVSFDAAGGTAVAPQDIAVNSLITPPIEPEKEGYAFAGWYLEPEYATQWNFDLDYVTVATTLYAKWVSNTYTVTFDCQGGSIIESLTAGDGSYISEPAEPTRTGYAFGGWFKDPACTQKWTFATDKVIGDTTLYAMWIGDQYSVTFNSQGGSAVGTISTDYNTAITAPSAPTRSGYSFGGWYKEADCLNTWTFATDKVTSATTLYAKWVPNTYTIVLNANGATGAMASIGMTYDASISLPTNTFAKTGYSFAGWATSPTGSVVYANQASVKNLTITSGATVALYAKWTPNTYNIKFNGNGGTSGTMSALSMTYDASKALTANAFKRTGYSFLGWATTSTGAVVYKDLASVKNLTSTKGATINLYAKWGASITSAVSYNYNSIKVSWAYAGSATSYKIYRATSATGTYSLVKTAASTSRYWIDTSRVTGKTYYYKIYPVAGGKTYTHSTYKYAKAIPATPTVTLSKTSTTSMKITWTGVSGATKYQVYRATSATGTYSLVYTASSTLRFWTNTGLTAGKTYYYKVRAYHLEGTTKVYGSTSVVKYLKL